MTIATFQFSLPDDKDANQIVIQSSLTQTGSYGNEATAPYEYGAVSYEYKTLDITRWYRIQFVNTLLSESGPFSQPVYGGDVTNSSPFLAIGTETEGSNFATIADVFAYSNLTSSDITSARVSQALRSARAFIDLKTADMNIDRFKKNFRDDVSARKYNASLRVLKEAEISLALSNVYRDLSDNQVLERMRSGDDITSMSLGGAALQLEGNRGNDTLAHYLKQLSESYKDTALELIRTLAPTSVSIRWAD